MTSSMTSEQLNSKNLDMMHCMHIPWRLISLKWICCYCSVDSQQAPYYLKSVMLTAYLEW